MNPIKQQKLDQELRTAVAAGNIHAIRQCLAQGAHPGILADNPFVPGEQRLPAFFWGVMAGNLATVMKLLEMGFDPSLKDEHGRSALFYVQSGPQGVQMWNALVEMGLDPDAPDNEGGRAWSNHPEKASLKSSSQQRTWKAPRPTLGPSRRPDEEDDD